MPFFLKPEFLKRSLKLGLALVAVVVAVLVGRALTARSHQVDVDPAPPLAIDAEAVAGRLAGAIEIPTISSAPGEVDEEALRALRAYLAEQFPVAHAALDLEVVGGLSLLYTWSPGHAAGARPAAVLLGHLDVVPADAADWSHPPFADTVADGFVWGRGALDDKVNVLGLLEAVEWLAAEGFQPARPIHLAFGHDEEVGGADGAAQIAALLERRGVRAELVLDEGMTIVDGLAPGVGGRVALIGLAEKGYATLQLVARAEGGHSSMPPAETAVGTLARALVRLEENPMPARIDGPTAEFFDHLAPETSFGFRVLLRNRWLFDPLIARVIAGRPSSAALLRTTTAPTMLAASPKDNILARTASASVNFRIHPRDRVADVVAHVEGVVADPRIEVRVGEWAREPSAVSATDGAGWEVLVRTVREVFPGVPAAPILTIAATDARHYERISDAVYRFSPVVLGPEDTARIHGVDERLAVADYARAVRFYIRLLRNLGSIAP